MATIIDSNTTPSRTVLVDSSDSSAGWAVATVLVIAIVLGGAFWYVRYYRPAAYSNTNTPGTTVQVNVPAVGYAPATQ